MENKMMLNMSGRKYHSIIRVPRLVLILLLLCIRIEISYQLYSSSDKKERTSALYPGDFIIGALFSIHHQPRSAHFLDCGDIREMYGIQRAEVTFMTLDQINADPDILPNITLGAEIRDSCWYAPVALQQTIELVRDSITPQTSLLTCPAVPAFNLMPPAQNTTRRRGTLIGVLGPGSSSVAMQVQNLLQLFAIPQIAYSATSQDLSDKARFSTFLRVVPSDRYQAQLLVDLVRYYNWTYVLAVNTDENYGQSSMAAFRELAGRAKVCIAREYSILSTAAEKEFDALLERMVEGAGDPRPRVLVCFCEGKTVRGLLAALRRRNRAGDLLIIGSDGWADRSDVTSGFEREARGSISVRIHSPAVQGFEQHYVALRPKTNLRNPWFREFWQSKFSCRLPGKVASAAVADRRDVDTGEFDSTKVKDVVNCTGEESLSEGYRQEPKLAFVVRAVQVMARALHRMQLQLCGRAERGLCAEMLPFNGSLFKDILWNTSFDSEGERVEFDKQGDPPGRYEIMSYQLINGQYEYVKVGKWVAGKLSLFGKLEYAGAGVGEVTRDPTRVRSVCSQPCDPGYYKNVGEAEKQCCWTCVPCPPHSVQHNETSCRECSDGSYPSYNNTVCITSPIEYVQWTDTEAVVSIAFACAGFIATIFTGVVFIRHHNTPVVKASTRELSYLILVGMILSYASTFAIIAKPTTLTCTLSRSLPGISFSMIYASLFTKTNRIARILAGSKKRFPTRKPRFMSGTAQLVISGLLIGVEVSVAGFMLYRLPAAPQFRHPSRSRTVLACASSAPAVLLPLAPDFALVALCTIYAVNTRRLPENFNEAKFIGFAMYTTCVIWIAFVPIYFGSESKIITMCMCVILSAMVTLIFLFAPKLYIILLKPEKNNRALFITSKSIRCHIGARAACPLSDKSSNSLTTSTKFESLHSHDEGREKWNKEDVRKGDRGVQCRHTSRKDAGHEDVRTISCQTSLEQLCAQILDQKDKLFTESTSYLPHCIGPAWIQLNPNSSLDNYKSSNNQHKNEYNRYLSDNIHLANPILGNMVTKSSEFSRPKARIREENLSQCSLADEDGTQIKSITITLGSTGSLDRKDENLIDSTQNTFQNNNMLGLRKAISESPIMWTNVSDNLRNNTK